MRFNLQLLRMSAKAFKMDVKNLSLLHNKAYVNGEWVSAKSGKTFNVLNPATGEVIGEVPDMDLQDVQVAIEAAHNAFPSWSSITAKVNPSSPLFCDINFFLNYNFFNILNFCNCLPK